MVLNSEQLKDTNILEGIEKIIEGTLIFYGDPKNETCIPYNVLDPINPKERETILNKYRNEGWYIEEMFDSSKGESGYYFSQL